MDKFNAEFEKADFSRSLRGYSVSEVDKYVKRLTEAYSALYRENVELEGKLFDAEEKISELTQIKDTLDDAKRRSDEILRDAYENADGILFSVKSNCDAILKGFKRKVEEQRQLLSEARRNVEMFQRELFEKYKIHIELIQGLSSGEDDDEIVSADDYVERVVTNLKREISAEYGLTIDTVEVPEGISPGASGKPDISDVAPAPSGDEKYVRVGNAVAAETRRPSALEMLSEYEKRQAAILEDDGVQLALDIDAGTSSPSGDGDTQ